MKWPPRSFLPAGKVVPAEETIGDRLKKMAQASLPHFVEKTGRPRRKKRYCTCGARLYSNAKVRQGCPVCDNCAKIIPRLPGGRKKIKKD